VDSISRGILEHTARIMFEQCSDIVFGHTKPAQAWREMA
jgi:hypothetical protein